MGKNKKPARKKPQGKKTEHVINSASTDTGYFSCALLNALAVNFNGRIDTGEKRVRSCCEPVEDVPAVGFGETGKETIESFIQLRNNVISESALPASGRTFSNGCVKCANYQQKNWQNDNLIHYVNLSMYPAPCQCRCIYCGVYKNDGEKFSNPVVRNSYEKMFGAIEYAQKSGLITPDATWQVSSGEITIHPYKDRIFSIVKNQTAVFYTNCFKYDEQIGENLSANSRSAINLSIDSGTPNTWRKIKGFDNFDEVTDNLVKYYKSSARAGQITLKYIVLPDINDNYEDFASVIEIMKTLKVKHLTLARDGRTKYSETPEDSEKLAGAAGYLLAMLHTNQLTYDMFTFSPIEREKALLFAKKLVSTGEVQ